MATAPRREAERGARAPRNVPTGVRAAERMKTSFMAAVSPESRGSACGPAKGAIVAGLDFTEGASYDSGSCASSRSISARNGSVSPSRTRPAGSSSPWAPSRVRAPRRRRPFGCATISSSATRRAARARRVPESPVHSGPTNRKRHVYPLLAWVSALVVLLLAVGLSLVLFLVRAPYQGYAGEDVVVSIAPRTPSMTIFTLLESKGVLRDARLGVVALKIFHRGKTLMAGEY